MSLVFLVSLLSLLTVNVDGQQVNGTDVLTSPGINPALAFNPLLYNVYLTGYVDCPEFKDQKNRCLYYTFRKDVPALEPYMREWQCEEGNFCLTPKMKQKCSPGFYCPKDTVQPTICPPGYFCSTDAKTIQRCPAGFYCPAGTTSPLTCAYLAYCPVGSKTASKFVILIIFAVAAVFVWFLFLWRQKVEAIGRWKQRERFNQRVETTMQLELVARKFHIEFENLGLTLGNGMTVMSGVSGRLHSGRTCAIMGMSGSGKTTFMTLLTGKVRRTTGKVRVNGIEQELSKFKKIIGYVPQDDIMLRELTVRDILTFSARMRLPSEWKDSRKIQKVNEVIAFLGLTRVADCVIGDERTRGISGGQRKRVNIGIELVAEPSILFLDEPTSGLDSATAYDVCAMLGKVAKQQGVTVAAVIHSPSPATFRQFDDLLLFGKGGRIVYFGPREEAPAYFDYIGFSCPPYESPSDFYMNVMSGYVQNMYDYAFHPEHLPSYWEIYREGKNPFEGRTIRRNLTETAELAKRRQSTLPRRNQNKKSHAWKAFTDIFRDAYSWCDDILTELFETFGGMLTFTFRLKDPVRNTPSVFTQFVLCTRRSFYQVYRSAKAFLRDLFLHLGVGIFISVAIQDMDFITSQPDEVCAITPGALRLRCTLPSDMLMYAGMFIAMGAMFAGISIGSSSFGKEKVVFWRDTAAGMSTIAYYMGKVVVDIPRILLGAFIYTGAVSLVYPFRGDWLSIVMITIPLYFVAFAMGYFVSYALNEKSVALGGTAFALLWALALSGVQPSLSIIKETPSLKSLSFLWSISPPRWSIEAFWIKEVQGRPFLDKNKEPLNTYKWENFNVAITNIMMLTLVWNICAFLLMKVTNRSKQK